MPFQKQKQIKNDTDTQPDRTVIWVLLIVLFFLLIAWITWCFFEWKIKAVASNPQAYALSGRCPTALAGLFF